jgi:hypothetical protein
MGTYGRLATRLEKTPDSGHSAQINASPEPARLGTAEAVPSVMPCVVVPVWVDAL